MIPVVDQETCIGCGACEAIVAKVFKLTDGKAQVIKLEDYTVYKDKIEQAVDACPVQAISIKE